MTELTQPHGGELKDLLVSENKAISLKEEALGLPSWDLTARQLCDIELLINGGFSPLDGFLNQADYDRVIKDMRLANGTVWPMPITLDVNEDFAAKIAADGRIALRDPEGVLIAVMTVTDNWTPDKKHEAVEIFGADDSAHPAVDYLHNQAGNVYLGGPIFAVELPRHYDFSELRETPRELRDMFKRRGWSKIVAFQTRNPMHRAHQELTFRAAQQAEANLLIHPVVGMTKPGDINHYTRVHCYEHLIKNYPEQTTALSLLPLAMRMGGPREALWHALIRKNYGCTHFIVGRDHAGPGKNSQGEDFYGPYDAQDLITQFHDEIEIEMIPFQMMVYVEEKSTYVPIDETSDKDTVLNISGTELRQRLRDGTDIPDWFTFPAVAKELRKSFPAKHKQGFTVFFTGLSGSGKSTIANALMVKLLEMGRPVTLLDGDHVRQHLSSELGFSKEHRDLNIQRIGYVASEITKFGGVAICAPIAPYTATRRVVRDMIENYGTMVEIHVATSVEECEKRDRKGLYAKARAGEIKNFTGISDPYEAPVNPDLRLETVDTTPDFLAQQVILKLENLGLIK